MRTRRAFTFTELIAAMAIIMLIAGLLFPVFIQARQSARGAACRSNIQQLSQALHLYAQDNNGYFPPGAAWTAAAMPYCKNRTVFACPSEPEASKRRFGSGVEIAGSPAQNAAPTTSPGAAPSQPSPGVYTSYQYAPGLANDDPSDTPLLRDWATWHMGQVNVGFVGGHVERQSAKKVPPLVPGPRPLPGPDYVPPPPPPLFPDYE
jgi:prepilin-type processing-associated H-X9-DG protein